MSDGDISRQNRRAPDESGGALLAPGPPADSYSPALALTGSAAAASSLLRREPIKTLICLHTRKRSPWVRGRRVGRGEGLVEEALVFFCQQEAKKKIEGNDDRTVVYRHDIYS